MAHNRPIQVFTDMKQPSIPSRQFISNSNSNIANVYNKNKDALGAVERQINVTGVGELTLPPDRFTITIKCKASKDNVEDAKASVAKRQDYIVQTLKNSYLKEEDYRVYESINYQDSAVVCGCEIEAHFIDIGKCLSISNLLVEKLKSSVSVSLPVCYHAPGSLDILRKQVGMLAIHSARQKAMEMAKVVHMSVGPPIQVQEHDFSEAQGSLSCDQEEANLSPSVRQKVGESTIRVSSRVSVCFQLRTKQKSKA